MEVKRSWIFAFIAFILVLLLWVYLELIPQWIDMQTSELIHTFKSELNGMQNLEKDLMRMFARHYPRGPEPGAKKWVISFALYSDHDKYMNGAVANAELAKLYYPGWTTRYYVASDVSAHIIALLERQGAEIVRVQQDFAHGMSTLVGNDRMLWRLQVAVDPTVSRFIIRDVDSRLNSRESAAVAEWIQSGKAVHVMRDHPTHCQFSILGGMWGATGKSIPSIGQSMTEWVESIAATTPGSASVGDDQVFLKKHVWSLLDEEHDSDTKNSLSVHENDAYCCRQHPKAHPFPTVRRSAQYVGQIHTEKGDVKFDHYTFLETPKNCRNPDHLDAVYG